MCNIVRVYHEEDVTCVLEKYILPRGRKDLLRDYTKIPVPYYALDKNPVVKRYLDFHKEFEEISNMAIPLIKNIILCLWKFYAMEENK